jgi:hypothetical protein
MAVKLFRLSNSSSRTSRLSEVLLEDYELPQPTQLCCRKSFVAALLTLQDVDAQGRLSLRIQQHKASTLRG